MIIRKTLKYAHLFAAVVTMLSDLSFMTATIYAELSFDREAVRFVKAGMVQGLFVLIPALALTGLTGMGLSGFKPKGMAMTKLKRLQIIVANGLFILLPSVLFLNSRAQASAFDELFWAVQTIEYFAGAINIGLLGLNMRDGFKMSGRLRKTSKS